MFPFDDVIMTNETNIYHFVKGFRSRYPSTHVETLFRLSEVNLSHDDVFVMIKVNKQVSSDILVKLLTGKYHLKGGFNPTSEKNNLTICKTDNEALDQYWKE